MCCDFHIGVNFAKKRFECRKKCQKVIKKKAVKGKKNKKNKQKNSKNKRKNSKNKGKNSKNSRKSKGKKKNKNKKYSFREIGHMDIWKLSFITKE